MESKAPKKIYLQIRKHGYGETDIHSTTWCEDKIYELDIEYIRSDLVKESEE